MTHGTTDTLVVEEYSQEFAQFLIEKYGIEDVDYTIRCYYRTDNYIVLTVFDKYIDEIVYFKESGRWTYAN